MTPGWLGCSESGVGQGDVFERILKRRPRGQGLGWMVGVGQHELSLTFAGDVPAVVVTMQVMVLAQQDSAVDVGLPA